MTISRPRWPTVTWWNRYDTVNMLVLREKCPLDNGRHEFPPPERNLGSLQILPPELLDQVLENLDVPSLTFLRQVNRGAMRIVDEIPEYAWMVKNYIDVLRSIVASNARFFTYASAYHALQGTKCHDCDRDADYFYLISGTLICRGCLHRVLDREHICKHLRAEARVSMQGILDSLPHIQSLPVEYFKRKSGQNYVACHFRKRLELYDLRHITRASRRFSCDCHRFYTNSEKDTARRYQAVIPFTPLERPEISSSPNNGQMVASETTDFRS
jgi:hypothetical protein